MLHHASSMAMMGCALLASSAMAFNPSEIDKVDITVDYTDDAKDVSGGVQGARGCARALTAAGGSSRSGWTIRTWR